ncbi:MAG: hypothetical protein QOJ64_3603 [Acidobacteriota bacterium]|jgi:hypothetical protein|nr:hypothetical protein [Acidobacteriota bacterium]
MSFRLIILVCLLLVGNNASGAPTCAQLKINPDAWITARVNALVSSARASYEEGEPTETYAAVLGGITGTLRRCKLSKDDDFVTRYREFVEYVNAASLDQDPNHELGFIVSDKQYFDETRQYTAIPEFLLAARFLQAVSRFETLNQAKAYLRELNRSRSVEDQLIFFSYKSRHLGTPDNNDSYRRLLIVVPGSVGAPEKWVQFGVTDPGERTRVRNVSVVAASLHSDGVFDAYFKDFYRTYRRDGSIGIKGRWELGEGDDNCVSCHKSGILPIFPAKGSLSRDELDSLQLVNERFRSYGVPRFDKYLDASKFGPGLGAISWQKRAAHLGSKFEESRLGSSMSCASCHNTERLGSLNWPMDQTLVRSYIEGAQMPIGVRIPETQRHELHDKLIEEYFSISEANPGILKEWLLGRRR